MKLPIPFIGGKTENEEHYLALLLADEKVSAVVLQEYEGKIKIIGKHEQSFSESLEHTPLDEITDVVDKTISHAEEVLPPDIETHKTVFGVKEAWVDKETKKIKKEYLAKLKKICDSLDLAPIGFMVTSEAISNLLQEEEGAPLSAILAEIGKKMVTLTLFRAGNILQTINGEIENGAAATVDKLLKHFTIEVLPARIIIYDSDTTEELAQKFISHQWSKSIPFLHMPQISILPQGFDAKSVTHGAAEQMGLTIQGEQTANDIKTFEHEASATLPHTPSHGGEKEITHQKTETHPVTEPVHSAAEFGFLVGEDITTHPPPAPDTKDMLEPETPEDSQADQESRHDLLQKHISDNLRLPEDTVAEEDTSLEDEEEEEETPSRRNKTGKKNPLGAAFASLGHGFSSLHLPKMKLGGDNKMKIVLMLIPILLIIIVLAGAYAFYTYKVKATVTLAIKPNLVNASQDVTFSSSESTDFSQNSIAAKKVTASVDGTASGQATGTQQVGDKAKGTVTLYNSSTTADAKLSSGTTITSSNGLKYTLDKDVDVASASGDIFSGTKPGTTDASVTASDIGPDYNLPSGTKFNINSEVAAKNGSAFSGGTKKNVTVVSKNDLTNLKSQLQDQLQDKANDELTKQTSNGDIVIPAVLSTSLDKAKFDKQAGDQAKTVTVTGTVTFTGLSYKQDDLLSFAKVILKNHYAQDVTFQDNSIKADLNNPTAKDKTIVATAHIEAGLLPKINGDDLARQLAGKSMKDVQDTLSHLPQISSNQISYSPNLFILSKLLPRLPKQVNVVIQSNE